jgi:hypothetical protein
MRPLPLPDPAFGDRAAADLIETVVIPKAKDLGGFTVGRALPTIERRMVGPFVLFDQAGPAEVLMSEKFDVRPHPHIGLATVTYIYDGAIMHRDSIGSQQLIEPGDVNWMTAGRGIAHSERTPTTVRSSGGGMYGIQSWIALPEASEEIDPSFQHFDAADLPVIEDNGVWARVIAGSAFGKTSPVGMYSPWLYAEVVLAAGASAPLDPDQEERAIYVVDGEVEIAGESFEGPRLLIFRPGDRITVKAKRRARLMFLGGTAMEGPRYIWWNFVSSRKERIEEAKEAWKTGRFKPVPGDSEFIPLPTS